jgi:hypothetical protein
MHRSKFLGYIIAEPPKQTTYKNNNVAKKPQHCNNRDQVHENPNNEISPHNNYSSSATNWPKKSAHLNGTTIEFDFNRFDRRHKG